MTRARSSVSQAETYREVGEFWDTHDLGEFWDQTRPASFDVEIEGEVTLYALDRDLSEEVGAIARERGISSETLVNLWVQEKVREHSTQSPAP